MGVISFPSNNLFNINYNIKYTLYMMWIIDNQLNFYLKRQVICWSDKFTVMLMVVTFLHLGVTFSPVIDSPYGLSRLWLSTSEFWHFCTLFSPDQIALPDFNAGAMENWGLVTYRETALLYHPMISSTGNKERIATVIAHELAHMVIFVLSSHLFYQTKEREC